MNDGILVTPPVKKVKKGKGATQRRERALKRLEESLNEDEKLIKTLERTISDNSKILPKKEQIISDLIIKRLPAIRQKEDLETLKSIIEADKISLQKTILSVRRKEKEIETLKSRI